MSSTIKVVLADDHDLVLMGVKEILSGFDDIEVMGMVNNGQEVLDFLAHESVDIAILDINMPVMDGISCAKHIKISYPEVKVILLTQYSQKIFIEEILKLGIEGCLLKNNTVEDLYDAVIRVDSGKFYYDQIKSFTSEEVEVFQFKLTERELEIIKLATSGETSREIAEKLFISENTVTTHRKNIMRKTKTHNVAQLVQFARDNNII
ncbi:MAG: response regulator transcription factor [Cyclobacteriaceae bacterium]|nr:response regulator transcription factor [Cyclobacteriaceae bacterium]